MEEHAYIGELLAGIVYLIAGIRLLRLSQRTGEAPERLLGASFCAMAVSLFFYQLPNFPVFESVWTALVLAGRVCVIPSVVIFALFTWRVFRPAERWGEWLVWGTGILLVIGVGGSALGGDWEGYSISSGWFWFEWVGYTLPYGWAGVEAFVQFGHARRRLRLGLCDALVCNRYLLWASFGVLQVSLSLVILPQYYEYETSNHFAQTWDSLYGAIGIASIGMMWLTFFPPAFYKHWIQGSAPAVTAAEG